VANSKLATELKWAVYPNLDWDLPRGSLPEPKRMPTEKAARWWLKAKEPSPKDNQGRVSEEARVLREATSTEYSEWLRRIRAGEASIDQSPPPLRIQRNCDQGWLGQCPSRTLQQTLRPRDSRF
jgi:hypothetical protein